MAAINPFQLLTVYPPQTIHMHYTGILDITNEMRRILGRSANAQSTEFGNSCTVSLLYAVSADIPPDSIQC
jgi:hypothetical protein